MKADPKLSILFLGTQMAVGGAQKVLLDQARWFHEHGYKVTAVFFYDKDGLYEKWMVRSDFPIVDLKALRPGAGVIRNTVAFLRGLWWLWKLLSRGNFDVIETFTHDSNVLGIPLAWMARVPIRIATHHGSVDNLPRWREQLDTWLINYNIANILVAVSETTRQNALHAGIHADRVLVIPNGINAVSIEVVDRHIQAKPDSQGKKVVLLSVGRLVREKAYDVLIRAASIVVRQYPNMTIQIAGEGPLHTELLDMIMGLGLGENVHLLGIRDDIVSLMLEADIFVMSSRSEGMPMALLEAMSAGLPVIATRVGGMGEVIRDGQEGILIDPESPDELAKAMLRLAQDSGMRSNLGQRARQRVEERYTIEHMCMHYAKTMLSLYQSKQ